MVMQIKLLVLLVLLLAQVFPNYDTVALTNNCKLRCTKQENGLYGILALRAKTMIIDSSSLILTNGKGIFLND